MNITDYIIDIENTSLADRLRLRQVLLDNNQQISELLVVLNISTTVNNVYYYNNFINKWCGSGNHKSNISLQDFINKFKVQDQLENLAFYKRSGKPWTHEELINIASFCNTNIPYDRTDDSFYSHIYNRKYVYKNENTYESWYPQDIKNCFKVAYEDVFTNQVIYPLVRYYPEKDLVVSFTSLNTGFALGSTVEECFEPHTSSIWQSLYVSYVHDYKIYEIHNISRDQQYIHKDPDSGKIAILNPNFYQPAKLHQQTTQFQQKEQTMTKFDLKLLTALMSALLKDDTPQVDATNANHIGIITENDEYVGYIYFNDMDEATKIMQQPINESRKLHIFDYKTTLAQKPRKIIEVERT